MMSLFNAGCLDESSPLATARHKKHPAQMQGLAPGQRQWLSIHVISERSPGETVSTKALHQTLQLTLSAGLACGTGAALSQ